ncbi:unnamed protein product, partial [Larinioides sclopetarius]
GSCAPPRRTQTNISPGAIPDGKEKVPRRGCRISHDFKRVFFDVIEQTKTSNFCFSHLYYFLFSRLLRLYCLIFRATERLCRCVFLVGGLYRGTCLRTTHPHANWLAQR